MSGRLAVVGAFALWLACNQYRRFAKAKGANEFISRISELELKEVLHSSPSKQVVLLHHAASDARVLLVFKSKSLPTSEALLSDPSLWKLSTESGAEYSYYTIKTPESVEVECVWPASEALIAKHRNVAKKIVVVETPEAYQPGNRPSWVDAILKGEKEVDRVLTRTHDFVVVADTNKWLDMTKPTEFPYALAFTVDPSLRDIRSLRSRHVPMLKEIKRIGVQAIVDKSPDTDPKMIQCFFHYPPQFYSLHVHFCRLDDERADARALRARPLDDVIHALEVKDDYWEKACITMIA